MNWARWVYKMNHTERDVKLSPKPKPEWVKALESNTAKNFDWEKWINKMNQIQKSK